MNKFLQPLFLLCAFSFISSTLVASEYLSKDEIIKFDLCLANTSSESQVVQQLTYNTKVASILSTDCNMPTNLSSGTLVSGNTSGGDLYYQIIVPAGQNVVMAFSGVPGATAEVITNCVTQSPVASPYCGGGTYLIRVSGTPGAFDLTMTAYTTTVTIDITENSGIPNNGVVCEGSSISFNANPVLSGGATVSGYAWSSGQGTQGFTIPSATLADSGPYSVTVTDNNGCTFSSSVTVTVHPLPTAAITLSENSGNAGDGEICNGDQATLTASGGNTYAWSNGFNGAVNVVSPTTTTTYTVTVTDANGCTDTEDQQVIVNPLPVASITFSETSGNTNNDGNICENDPITISANSGGFTYLWNTFETSQDISPSLAVGPHTFTVTITDSNGCTDSETVSVTVFPEATAAIVVTEMSGTTNNDGNLCFDDQLTLTASGGVSYAWSNGANGSVLNDFPPVGMHTYTVTVTDLNGCTASTETTVEVFDLPIADITVVDMSAQNDDDGLICFGDDATLTATGANGGTYLWSNGSATDFITVSPAVGQHTYTVTVTDLNGCTDTDQFMIEVFALPMPTITIAETSGLANNDGTLCAGDDLTLTGVDADPMTVFEWTLPNGTVLVGNPLMVTNIDNTLNGVFTVTADNNGCTNTATVTITVSDPPDPVVIEYDGSGANFTVCTDEMFSLDATVGSGSGTYTYSWTLPNGSTQSGNPISFTANQAAHQGVWNVTVTDNFGCTGTDNIQVTVAPGPPNNSCGSAVDLGSGTGQITASGNNECGLAGGGCGGPDNEAAVYFSYTVPACGLSSIQFRIGGSHFISVSPACGGGACTQDDEIQCPDPNSVIYITVSSSHANAGNFSLTVTPVLNLPPITGTAFVDLNMNNTYENGIDIPLGGVSVAAYPDCNKGSSPILATTDDSGNYSFTGLPTTSCEFLISLDPNSMVDCAAMVEECVMLDPCASTLDPIFFPCPPPNCTANPFSVDNFCDVAFADPLCDLRLIDTWPCGQNPSVMGPWLNSAHCGGVFHNTSFYAFVAGSGNYDINFTIFGCAGQGVQYGIQDNCNPGGPYVVCNGGANGEGVTITIPSSGLIPCNTYVFWIDGFAGSVCSYYAWVSGNWNNCSVPPLVDITVDFPCTPLCPSTNPLTLTAVAQPGSVPAIEDIQGASYTWTVRGGPSGTNFETTIDGPDGLSIDFPFLEAGTYEVCITSYHPCDGYSNPLCRPFIFEDIDPTFMPFVVCTADFPWSGAVDEMGEPIVDIHGNQFAWFGGDITLAMVRTSPPTFNFSSLLQNECGCYYTQQLRITEATAAIGIDTLAVCQSQLPYTYGGITFTGPVTDTLIKLNIKSKNGCDSLISFTSRVLNMGGTISDVCVQGGFEMQFNMGLQFINAERDSIRYVWKDSNGNVLTDNNNNPTNIVVTSVGTYSLEVTVFKYGTGCTFTFNRTINLTGRLPLAPIADNWPLKICENDNLATYNVLTPDPNLIYLWTVPTTATKVMDDSTGTLIVRWNGPTGGNICVRARNLCGDGPENCLPVVYVDQITPEFTLATEVCKDNTTPITATSTHTAAPVVYNWTFDGGSSANTDGTGPGPHNVAWNSTGTKTVTLSVTENGCTGDPVSREIVVSELPPPPVLNCAGSTSSSVTFGWTSVPGAVNYTVTVISPAGVSGAIDLNNNTYTVTGLALGASITIQVTAVLTGPCGNVTSSDLTCTAEDCGDLPVITFTPIAPICLPGNSFSLDESMLTVNPPIANSVGSFFINGLPATEFDPNALGAGTHTILYDLEWDNGRCGQTGSTTVIVRNTPLSDFTVSPGGCVLDPVTVTYTGGTTGATFNWTFGADVIGTYNGAGPHNVRWTNPGAKTITLTVTRDGCTSIVTTQNVSVNPVLAAPVVSCADQRIDGVTFGWTSVTNASGYDIVVEIVGGAVIFSGTVTGTTYDVPGLTEGTEVRITVTAISTNGCPNTTGSRVCIATSCPPARITFPNQIISECLTPGLSPISLPFTIANNLPNEVPTVTWSSIVPAANNAINNSVSPATFDPQLAGVGSHSLVLTYRQKDCIWSDSILITLRQIPTASFTMDERICINESAPVNYTGTNTGGRVLTWDNGGGNRLDITQTSFGFTFPSPGTYTVGLTTTLNGCVSAPFSRSIVVEDFPAPPVVTCTESLDAITFSWTSIPCATQFDLSYNMGTVIGLVTNNSYTFSNLAEGAEREILIRSISTCECPIAPVSLMCKAKACPPVMITLTPAQTSLCLVPNVAKVQIALSITGNTPDGRGTWSGVGVDQNGLFDPAVAGLGTHEITYSYNDSNCDYVQKTSITVTELPRIVWETIQPKCYSDVSGSGIFEIQGGTPPYRLTNDGVTVTASPITNVPAGNHTFVVTDANGCSAAQNFVITIPSQPSFRITGPGIVNINKQATHTLDLAGMAAYINAIDSVVWFWNGARVCSGDLATCSSITNSPPVGPNSYAVTIYYNNGCKVVADFSYVVTDTYITTFPNIINPFSTSGNREFRITTSDPSLFVKKMRVYDRWGNLAFISENFSAFTDPVGWNGSFGGREVVPGVYVYIFEMSSDSDDDIVERDRKSVV